MNDIKRTKTLQDNVLSIEMTTNLAQLFKTSAPIVPEGISERIFDALECAAKRQAQVRRALWGAFSGVSFVAFIAGGYYAANAANASGFTSYFSLIFSDGTTAASLWREVGLSLVESLPLLGTLIVIGSIAAMLWSIRNFSKYQGRFITSPRIA
jgi:hypothetical protein